MTHAADPVGPAQPHADRPLAALACALLSAMAAMGLYALTVAPTISWGDSADLAMRLVYDGDPTFDGTHRDYVLWRWIGQVAAWLPVEDAGLRANLFTGLWGAVTVGAVAGVVQVLTRSVIAGVIAGCALAVAHSFWLLSVIAEVYTFNAAVVFLAYACVALWWVQERPRWLWPAAVFAGLSLAHHATGLVLIASVAPLLLARLRRIGLRDGLIALALLLAVSLPYWVVTLPRLVSDMGFLAALGLSMSQNVFFEVSVPREAFMFGAYLTYNFLGPALLLGLAGLVHAVRRRLWPVLPPLIWAGAFVYAGLTSSIPDKFNVYVLVYPAFAILVGIGMAWGMERFALRWRGAAAILAAVALVPPAGYAAAVRASDWLGIDLVGARQAPLRDNNAFFLWPPKTGDFGPRIFAETALADMPADGILIADYTLWRPLYFVQAVEAQRTDVQLVFVERLLAQGVDSWIDDQPCDRRVFLATDTPGRYYQLDRVRQRFEVRPEGSIFEVLGRCPAEEAAR